MHRLLVVAVALALALSPVAITGLGGTHTARADLGWCDTCSSIGEPIPGMTPIPYHHR